MSEHLPDRVAAPVFPALLGLSGWVGQAANLTAVALVCVMFWQSQERLWEQVREDREMFAAQLDGLRADATRGREALDSLSHSVESLASEVRELRREKP